MPENVMRRLDWSFPPRPVERELIELLPDQPGDRPPLLFVHGAGHGAWCWAEHWMPEAAARGWPTYAVSLRGHGESGGHEDLWSTPLRHYEHDVFQAIIRLPEPPVLVGHSMGGLVVQRVLARYPARAGVLVGAIDPPSALEVALNVARGWPLELARTLVGLPLRMQADMLFSQLHRREAEALAARMTPEAWVATMELTLPRRRQPSKAPVLALGGGADRLVPATHAVRLARHYGTEARLFSGMGHDLMLEADWKAPLDAMLAWLDEELGR